MKARIADLQSKFKGEPVEVSWTKPENVHLTVRFLGDVEEARIEEVKGIINRAAEAHSRFDLQAGGCGVFPNERNPRVLWIGVNDEAGVLQPLVQEMEERLAAIGFAKEGRPFTPHLTLGRFRSERNA